MTWSVTVKARRSLSKPRLVKHFYCISESRKILQICVPYNDRKTLIIWDEI